MSTTTAACRPPLCNSLRELAEFEYLWAPIRTGPKTYCITNLAKIVRMAVHGCASRRIKRFRTIEAAEAACESMAEIFASLGRVGWVDQHGCIHDRKDR